MPGTSPKTFTDSMNKPAHKTVTAPIIKIRRFITNPPNGVAVVLPGVPQS